MNLHFPNDLNDLFFWSLIDESCSDMVLFIVANHMLCLFRLNFIFLGNNLLWKLLVFGFGECLDGSCVIPVHLIIDNLCLNILIKLNLLVDLAARSS